MQQPTEREAAGAAVPSPPPAKSPGHHAADRPLPRPPGSYTADRHLASPRGHYKADRPSPGPSTSPPGHNTADRPSPGPSTSPPGHNTADRPLPRPPGPSALPPWPYSAERHDPVPARRHRSSSALTSCLAAAAFLLLAAGGAGAALFLLFRPRPPEIAVAAVRLPSFAASNGTVAFTFEQTAVVRNPNRSPFAHFDSSLRVAYAGGELGSVYIPAGLIGGGRAKDMSAIFDVPAFPAATLPPPEIAASAAAQQPQPAAVPVIEVDSLLVVKGRVTVLRVLTHRVQAAKVCRVGVSPLDGRVLGFRC